MLVLAECAFALMLCWALCLPLVYGYYLAACSGGLGAGGMTLLVALAAPLVFPWLTCVLCVAAILLSAIVQPFRHRRLWPKLPWILLAALLAGVASWGIATIADLHARCSIGF